MKEVHSRRVREEKVELLVRWRHDYLVEVMGKRPGDALMAEARDVISRSMGEGSLFVLAHGQECVALTASGAGRWAELPGESRRRDGRTPLRTSMACGLAAGCCWPAPCLGAVHHARTS